MDLDEAIRHAEEKAKELESTCALWKRLSDERGLSIPSDYEPCKKCAEEHRQLAEWLKELKRVRELPWLKELKRLREQTRWIPCSERLPEEIENVIAWIERDVWLDGNDYPTRKQETAIGWHIDGRWHFDGYASNTKCIAWMPLPEPYKKEGEADESISE